MFLVRDIFFDTRGEPLARLWQRVIEARARRPELFGRAELFVLDHPPGKRCVCDGLIAAIAGLAPLRTSVRGRTAISSIGADVDVTQARDAIAAGVPRRFPLRWTVLASTWAAALAQDIPADHRGIPSPGQDMHPAFTGLKVSRRIDEDWWCASLALDAHGSARPELSAVVEEIGRPRWTETRVIASSDEARAARALRRQLDPWLAKRRVAAPVKLMAAASGRPAPRWGKGFDRLAQALGYRRNEARSEPRMHAAARVLASGNLLELVADLGGAGTPRRVGVDLVLQHLGAAPISLPVVPQTGVATEAQWAELLDIVRERVPELERDPIEALDAELGGSPAWFASAGIVTVAPLAS